MKTFTSFAVSMVLASAASPSVSGTHDRENLAQCKAELRKVFGDNSTLKLKSIKRSRNGTHMRIKTLPVDGESQMVTCRAASCDCSARLTVGLPINRRVF